MAFYQHISASLGTLIHRVAAGITTASAFVAVAYANPSDEYWYAYPLERVDGGRCIATAINNDGRIVGFQFNDEETATRGFVTGPIGRGSMPLSLGGASSRALGINSFGVVVGTAQPNPTLLMSVAFITDPNGMNIRKLSDDPRVEVAAGINDRGQIVGTLAGMEGARNGTAFFIGPDGEGFKTYHSLGSTASSGVAINNDGQVLGAYVVKPADGRRAFITGPDGKGMFDIDRGTGSSIYASGMNARGEVTGTIYFNREPEQQFATRRNGRNLHVIGPFHGKANSHTGGGGINDMGLTVGSAIPNESSSYLFLMLSNREGRSIDLNEHIANLPAGVVMQASYAINSSSQIGASGSDGKCYIVCPSEFCSRKNSTHIIK